MDGMDTMDTDSDRAMDGVAVVDAPAPRRLPPWLRRPLGGGEVYTRTARAVHENRLNTICEDARCPNRGECWSRGTATFMILGAECTRRCGFCSVTGGRPQGIVDRDEPRRLADAVRLMGLRYVVITSVDRDDLPDRGAGHFVDCIAELRRVIPGIGIELLTPDFRRRQEQALEKLLPMAPFVWGHNVETVPRLYRTVRPGSAYEDSLHLLRVAAGGEGISAKSSLMLGLGETRDEVLSVMDDLRAAGVERITLGQYLRPTPAQLDVVEYIRPEVFDELGEQARARGFRFVISAPFARSSYHAELEPDPEPASGVAQASSPVSSSATRDPSRTSELGSVRKDRQDARPTQSAPENAAAPPTWKSEGASGQMFASPEPPPGAAAGGTPRPDPRPLS